MNAKKIFGGAIKALITGVVLIYLALHTINFFEYTFPVDQWYYAYLGFGLTGGGMIAYLILFLWDAGTPLKKVIALVMTVVCGLGEIIVAVFGMRIETWAKQGWIMTETDFNSMMMAIQILAFAHLVALIMYFAGDKIATMFSSDADHDGIADWMDPVDNRTGQKFIRNASRLPQQQYQAETEQVNRSNGNHQTDPTNQPRR